MLEGRRRVAAAIVAVAGLALAYRLAGPALRSRGPDLPEPARLPLLWIEEVNSHLLPSGPGAASADPAPAPVPGDRGTEAAVDEAGRSLRLSPAHWPRSGEEPVIAIRYGVYDHDRLVREVFTILSAADLPYRVAPPTARREGGAEPTRLLPAAVWLQSLDDDQALALQVDGERVVLAPGRAWATARVAERGRVVTVDPGTWAAQLAAALDSDRAATVLRLLHRGQWRIEPLGREVP
ncbi:MAG TPA: hypothetical protein VF282_09840 [Bacillota bacterium]